VNAWAYVSWYDHLDGGLPQGQAIPRSLDRRTGTSRGLLASLLDDAHDVRSYPRIIEQDGVRVFQACAAQDNGRRGPLASPMETH
jgi:hypothetical protein